MVLAFVVLILGIMLQIPGIQVSVYAIPVWLLCMFVAYVIKSRRKGVITEAVGSAAK